MVNVIQISTKGAFSNEEVKKLLQCLKDIEQNDRSRLISVFMNLGAKRSKELEEVIGSIEPGIRITVI